jgi:hypothetical protein
VTEEVDDWEIFRRLKDARKEMRAEYGRPCPICQQRLPKASPKILMPGEKCKMHGYQDLRRRISLEERNKIFVKFGIVEQSYRGVKRT